jgi:hypothetical protein|tara:strand:- start:1370 stop:1537 length:168 start_codon:yes stop_codon:yes gene_type:complete
MFGIFKKKSKKEKLLLKYNEIKEKAFRISKVNRKESDRLECEANNILKEIDNLRS